MLLTKYLVTLWTGLPQVMVKLLQPPQMYSVPPLLVEVEALPHMSTAESEAVHLLKQQHLTAVVGIVVLYRHHQIVAALRYSP